MLVDTSNTHGLLFTRLVEEHREMLAMLDGLLALKDDLPARRAAFGRLARVLRIHARAEEEIVFPKLDGSFELGHHVKEDRAIHQAIDSHLRQIERSEAPAMEWLAEVEILRRVVVAHFDDEEKVVFPHAHCVISTPNERDLLVEYEQEREFLAAQTR